MQITSKKYKIYKKAVALVIVLILLVNPIIAKTNIATLKATYRNIKVIYKDSTQQVSREPYIVDGSVYMSIRDIANIFGVAITWNATTNTVMLGEVPNNQITITQTQYENRVLELINAERAKVGVKPLVMDEQLRQVARVKSTDMQANNYFDHISPTYGTAFDMLKSEGIAYNTAGENIAKGQRTPEEVVTAWMNSEGHRKNILNTSFTSIGVGYEVNGHYWTQTFLG